MSFRRKLRHLKMDLRNNYFAARARVLNKIDDCRIGRKGREKKRRAQRESRVPTIRSPRTVRMTIKLQAWFRGCILRKSFVGRQVGRHIRRWRLQYNSKKFNKSKRGALVGEPVIVPPGIDLQPILPPLPDAQKQLKRYFYDTGNSHDFRRCTRVRQVALPGDPIERLEALLLPGDGPMGAHLCFAEEDDDDPRMLVESVVYGGFAHMNGIRRGFRLTKVGDLEAEGDFATSAPELLSVLKQERREPLIVVFESSRWGMPDENCNLRASAFALKASNAARKARKLEKAGSGVEEQFGSGSESFAPAPPDAHPFATPQPPMAEPPNLVPRLAGGPFPPKLVQFSVPQPPPSQPPLLSPQGP